MSEAMTNAGRRSQTEWQRLMKEFETSGETQRAFCESRGIAYSTFCYWRRRLRAAEQKPVSEPPLVELPLFVGGDLHPARHVGLCLAR